MVVRVSKKSILGPLLFNIFMNDLKFAIEMCRVMNYTHDRKIHTSDSNIPKLSRRI